MCSCSTQGTMFTTASPMRRTDSPSRLSRNGRLFWRPTPLQKAVQSAANNGTASASKVTGVKEAKTTKGTAKVFSFSFDTDAEEIDFGVSGIRYSGKEAKEKAHQLGMQVDVGEGPAAFTIKENDPAFVISSINNGGFVDPNGNPVKPGKAYPPPIKHPVPKKGKGKEGDNLLDLLPGWRVEWDEWCSTVAYWGDEEPPVQSWELEPLLRGFLAPELTAMAEGHILTWEDAMTRGETALVIAAPLHADPSRGEIAQPIFGPSLAMPVREVAFEPVVPYRALQRPAML